MKQIILNNNVVVEITKHRTLAFNMYDNSRLEPICICNGVDKDGCLNFEWKTKKGNISRPVYADIVEREFISFLKAN